ncbi:hypothetical protein WJX74_000003 [Apatococcus lobatus]|uniref:Uncharacterized protein n=1 Tax=Apatococcus lobatus TaxID=904363 RepID=A0AAW1S8A1_9CHLO
MTDDHHDSCKAAFYAIGVDPINYQVRNDMNQTEFKQCVYDGSSSKGHGKCYAPTLELQKWKCDLNQAVKLSTSFGTGNPILMDGPISDKCNAGYGKLKDASTINFRHTDIDVYSSCTVSNAPGLADGVNCADNQQAGVCDKGFCKVTAHPAARTNTVSLERFHFHFISAFLKKRPGSLLFRRCLTWMQSHARRREGHPRASDRLAVEDSLHQAHHPRQRILRVQARAHLSHPPPRPTLAPAQAHRLPVRQALPQAQAQAQAQAHHAAHHLQDRLCPRAPAHLQSATSSPSPTTSSPSPTLSPKTSPSVASPSPQAPNTTHCNPDQNPNTPPKCGYYGKNGKPCCNSKGGPCFAIDDHPDCCQSDDSSDSCHSKFYADGADPFNYLAFDSNGNSEPKKCIYDGSSSSGHGRCYAPQLEANVWKQAFPQSKDLSDICRCPTSRSQQRFTWLAMPLAARMAMPAKSTRRPALAKTVNAFQTTRLGAASRLALLRTLLLHVALFIATTALPTLYEPRHPTQASLLPLRLHGA